MERRGSNIKKRWFIIFTVLTFIISCIAVSAFCAEIKYPTKPIIFVVPWGPGGMTDVTARLFSDRFKAELGQPVLVENKPGAAGILGLKYTISQIADGYTVVVGPMSDALSAPYFLGGEPLKVKDFSFVASYMPQERVLYVTPDKPYKTFQEFIDYAKKHPGQISVGSGGSQWAMEVIKSIAVKESLKLKYVMFKGGAEASTAILGKHVDICETGTGTPAFQAAREGILTLLVSLGSGTVPFFPDAKNVKQLGYPFWTSIEFGLAVRAGTPETIQKRLEDTLQKVLKGPEVYEKMAKIGLTPRFLDGKGFEKTVAEALKSVPEMLEYNKAVQ